MAQNRDLKAKLEQANEHYEAILQNQNNRETYRLAASIVDKLDPETSIAKLEALGKERLRQIVPG
jgi:flagellar motility protein MotE (MotC chaperone)